MNSFNKLKEGNFSLPAIKPPKGTPALFFVHQSMQKLFFKRTPALSCTPLIAQGGDVHKVRILQYLRLSQLSLQELQGFSVSLLAVLQGGQLLLHLPL